MNTQRFVRRRRDGLPVVTFRRGDFAAEALGLLPDGASVFVLPDGPHAVQVFTTRPRRGHRPVPLCRATRQSPIRPIDPAQPALPLR